MLEPTGQAHRREVIAATGHYVQRAGAIYSRRFREVPVLFDLSGRTAGMFKLVGRRGWIRYNPWIFAVLCRDLSDTVPHEVAHYIVHELYGTRVKPHCRQWRRSVMEHFGADRGVTFNLDLEGIPSASSAPIPIAAAVACTTCRPLATIASCVAWAVITAACAGDPLSYAGWGSSAPHQMSISSSTPL